MKRSRKIGILAMALLAALVLAACGGGGSPAGDTGGAGGSSGSGSAAGATVAVELYEWGIKIDGKAVDPQNGAELKAGEVTFSVKNVGGDTHAFEVKGNGIDESTDSIAPGGTATLTVTLEPGTYEIWCPVPGHKEAGMDGTLTVQ